MKYTPLQQSIHNKIVVWNFAGVCIFVVEERHNKVFNRSKELGVYT
jgi:hypothetical protein